METSENGRVIYEFGKFILDPQEKTLFADGIPIHLPAKEFDTLVLLVENSGRALRKEEMLQTLWSDTFVEENNLAKYVSRLRKLLNTNGQNYIETLPKHGYRFTAEINQFAQPIDKTILEKLTVERLTVMARARTKIGSFTAIVGLLVLATAVGSWYWSKTRVPAKIGSIAILPLRPLIEDENNKAIGVGLADALTTKLGSLHNITLIRTSTASKFADMDPLEIGRQLKADAVLEGTIQQSEGRIRINARLLNIVEGGQIWAETFDQPTSELFALQDELSNKIATQLAFEFNKSELERRAARTTKNVEAYEKYLLGRFYQSHRTEQGLTRSIEFYEEAIALDPNFADPYAGIADANITLYNYGLRPPEEVIPKTTQKLNQALQLDPNLSLAHLTAAQLAFHYERDGEKAERSYQKAIELDPNNADAFMRYGHFLTARGGFDEALTQLGRSRELNPLSPYVQMDIALVYLYRRDYPAAIEQLKRIIAENPEIPTPRWFLGLGYEGTGETDKAFVSELEAFRLGGGADLAKRVQVVKESTGIRAAYRAWLDETLQEKKQHYVPALDIAFLAAVLKDREQTLDWLEKAEEGREPTLSQIKYSPRYDFLRSDERFVRIVEKIDIKQK